LLPLFLIGGKPVASNLQIEVAITNGRLFQPLLQRLLHRSRDIVPHCPFDEAAALPGRAN